MNHSIRWVVASMFLCTEYLLFALHAPILGLAMSLVAIAFFMSLLLFK